MWEEEEEEKCSYTKATLGCGGGRAEDEGRLVSSTELPLFQLSAESARLLWERLSF